MAPNTTPTRYIQQDGPAFETAMKALDPNVEVKFVNANGDSNAQLSQANAAIAAGAKALVVVAADPNLSAGLLQAAEQANVPVIGYENPPIKGKMYAQVVFDPKKVGVQQAEYFAEQVKSGKLGAKPVKVARQYGNKGDVYTTEMLAGQNSIIDPLIASGDIAGRLRGLHQGLGAGQRDQGHRAVPDQDAEQVSTPSSASTTASRPA